MSATAKALNDPQAQASDREESLRRMGPARLRTDLVISKQLFKNEEYFVVKDPLALTYHRDHGDEAHENDHRYDRPVAYPIEPPMLAHDRIQFELGTP